MKKAENLALADLRLHQLPVGRDVGGVPCEVADIEQLVFLATVRELQLRGDLNDVSAPRPLTACLKLYTVDLLLPDARPDSPGCVPGLPLLLKGQRHGHR